MDDLMGKLQEILNDEESMGQIQKLAGMLGGENSENMSDNSSNNTENNGTSDNPDENSNENIDFDFSKIIKLQQIFSQANQKDKNTEFLCTLKPILKDENQMKIDKIIKVFKLMALVPLIKESGLLGGDLFDFL